MLLLLAIAWQDQVERFAPLVFVGIAAFIVVLRARERRRGPDDDEIDDEP